MENLRAAEICCEEGLYNACANRLYYSVFQAAIAALLHSGITRDKFEHKQVQADFSGELIRRRKIYPAKFKSYLSDMLLFRNLADYHSDDVSSQKAKKRLSEAKEMLEWINKEIAK